MRPTFPYTSLCPWRLHRRAQVSGTLVAATLSGALGIVLWQSRQFVQEGARSKALKDFVVALFENAASTPEGVPLDLPQLLDAGAQSADNELARQPDAPAALSAATARLRMGLGGQGAAGTLHDIPAETLERLYNKPRHRRQADVW